MKKNWLVRSLQLKVSCVFSYVVVSNTFKYKVCIKTISILHGINWFYVLDWALIIRQSSSRLKRKVYTFLMVMLGKRQIIIRCPNPPETSNNSDVLVTSGLSQPISYCSGSIQFQPFYFSDTFSSTNFQKSVICFLLKKYTCYFRLIKGRDFICRTAWFTDLKMNRFDDYWKWSSFFFVVVIWKMKMFYCSSHTHYIQNINISVGLL